MDFILPPLTLVFLAGSAFFFLGQTETISGWASLTSTGLLAAVLSWLFFHHLPAKDAQIEKKDAQLNAMLALKDAQIEKAGAANADQIKALVSSFRDEMRISREDCTIHMESVERRYDREQAERLKVIEAMRLERVSQHKEMMARLETVENLVEELRPAQPPGRRRPPTGSDSMQPPHSAGGP